MLNTKIINLVDNLSVIFILYTYCIAFNYVMSNITKIVDMDIKMNSLKLINIVNVFFNSIFYVI